MFLREHSSRDDALRKDEMAMKIGITNAQKFLVAEYFMTNCEQFRMTCVISTRTSFEELIFDGDPSAMISS